MRRLAIISLLLLALGLATSLTLAWVAALVDRSAWPDILLTRGTSGQRTHLRGWVVQQGRDATLTWHRFDTLDRHDIAPDMDAHTALPAWSLGHDLPAQPGIAGHLRERTFDEAWEVAAGWPWRCVRGQRTLGPTIFPLYGEYELDGLEVACARWPLAHGTLRDVVRPPLDTWPPMGNAALLPMRPMAFGLLGNTLLYAVAWLPVLLLGALPGAWRRRRRLARNRCLACAHALDGLPEGAPCPECGRDRAMRTPRWRQAVGAGPMLLGAMALLMMIAGTSALVVRQVGKLGGLPPLFYAAAEGDAARVGALIASGESVTAFAGNVHYRRYGSPYSHPLHFAAARGHLAAAERLVNAGASVTGDADFWGPLAVALADGDWAMFDLLAGAYGRGSVPSDVADAWPHAPAVLRARALTHFSWSQHDLSLAAMSAIAGQDAGVVAELVAAGLDTHSALYERLLARAERVDANAGRWPYGVELGLANALRALRESQPPPEMGTTPMEAGPIGPPIGG